MRRLIISFLMVSCAAVSRGQQVHPMDMVGLLSVDIQQRGGENVLFKNGEKLNKRQARVVLGTSPESLQTLNRAYRNRAAGRSFFAVGGAIFGAGIGMACDGENVGAMLGLAAAGGCIAAGGIPFIRAYNRQSRVAVDTYNRELFRNAVPRQTAELSFGVTSNGGIGLRLVF